jgi:hypothetical protein
MYLVNKLRARFCRPDLPPPTAAITILGTILREEIARLEPPHRDDDSTTAGYWLEKRLALRERLQRDDARRFMTFDEVRQTMFVDGPTYIRHELHSLRKGADWKTRWQRALPESHEIFVPRCPYYPEASGSAIHHAYHLQRFESLSGLKVEQMGQVFEFGGGFGGMCRLFHAIGFRGSYHIYDLPEFSALQRYYLQVNGIEFAPGHSSPGVSLSTDHLRFAASPCTPDLFLANWSLSEVPIEFRATVVSKMQPRAWLIGFQANFEEIDNLGFFTQWISARTRWKWRLERITHHPGENYYLVGS